MARLLQDITADGEWLARATGRQPSRLAFLRVSAGCTTLAQCGPRALHQPSNWDFGGGLGSSQAVQRWLTRSDGMKAVVLARDDRAANCRMMGDCRSSGRGMMEPNLAFPAAW